MLQTHTGFAGILHDARVARTHCLDERLDRATRRDVVSGVHDCKHGRRHALGTDRPATDLQDAPAEAVFAIEPVDELMGQFPRKGRLVESPTLDPTMNFQPVAVGKTERGVGESRPYECLGRR